ncbi:cytochrome-c oxidase, cbb3-type subunit III [bacterium]|nr:cytochrome-c oxidase, cbb3-type subunit III [bacterium]
MSVEERDPHSGYLTTGHDWNGIKELNTPVPRIVLLFIAVTHVFALVAWILLPTWPLGSTYTKGLLGGDAKTAVAADIAAATAARADWTKALATEDYATIRANPDLMARALETAGPLFGQNCQVCHGKEGIGGHGFPRLADTIWIWGGTDADIETTLRHGINSTDPDTRVSQMPAFGRDGLLTPAEIDTLVDYVPTLAAGVIPGDTSAGAVLFQNNCAACHGEDAKGVKDTGAQNLTDADWLYGGDKATIRQTLMNGRQGVMPAWQPRLSDAQIRMLTLYVQSLSAKGSGDAK